MKDLHQFLANIWFLVLALILALYVILDGFDLGVGILSCIARGDEIRSVMIGALRGIWDANEIWLVALGVALFGAFPPAYHVVLHALYVPIILMSIGLVLRAIAFELRTRSSRKLLWNLSFGAGSLLAVVSQGYVLGAFIQGIVVHHESFAGGAWDWLTPFATIVAVGVSAGYALLGATYLLTKTRGEMQRRNVRRAEVAGWIMVAIATAVIIWTPLLHAGIMHKWFSPPSAYYMVPLPIAAIISFALLVQSLRRGRKHAPFVWSITFVLLSFLGLALSAYPYIIPPHVTLAQAAAPSDALVFILTGIGMLIPLMLIYNGCQYLMSRGKVEHAGGGDEFSNDDIAGLPENLRNEHTRDISEP